MQVRGESMRGAGIHDRDLACIDRGLRAEDGSVVVAVVARNARFGRGAVVPARSGLTEKRSWSTKFEM